MGRVLQFGLPAVPHVYICECGCETFSVLCSAMLECDMCGFKLPLALLFDPEEIYHNPAELIGIAEKYKEKIDGSES